MGGNSYGDVEHGAFGDGGAVDDAGVFGDADGEWYGGHYSETFHSRFFL